MSAAMKTPRGYRRLNGVVEATTRAAALVWWPRTKRMLRIPREVIFDGGNVPEKAVTIFVAADYAKAGGLSQGVLGAPCV